MQLLRKGLYRRQYWPSHCLVNPLPLLQVTIADARRLQRQVLRRGPALPLSGLLVRPLSPFSSRLTHTLSVASSPTAVRLERTPTPVHFPLPSCLPLVLTFSTSFSPSLLLSQQERTSASRATPERSRAPVTFKQLAVARPARRRFSSSTTASVFSPRTATHRSGRTRRVRSAFPLSHLVPSGQSTSTASTSPSLPLLTSALTFDQH